MTTKEDVSGENLDKMQANLKRVEELTERLMRVIGARKPVNPTLNGPGPELMTQVAVNYWAEMMENPQRIYEKQFEYWGKSVQHFMEAQEAFMKEGLKAPEDRTESDKRFSNPLWQSHPYFNFVKQQYLINSDAIRDAVANVDDLSETDKRRLGYFSEQIIAMLAPTNFLSTNPDALERAVQTEGESLVRGLENLVADMEANDGELLVKLCDETAFELGRNVATSEGSVVFRNEMLELIQYKARTEEVHKTPLIIFPPWINKFYILDLKEQNSLIKWITEQGYTLFVVSWRNPGREQGNWGMADYIENGFLEAIGVVKEITGEKQVNTVGYCIAGTTLHLTLAYMKAKGDKSVKSATFFTALTDFGEQGEFTPFLQDDFVDGIEEEVGNYGVLRSVIMSRTMSFLRSNDLVYGPAIKSYMMGETPPAFDLLYWNGDATNLPGTMVMEYLRGLCQKNAFVSDGYELLGERLHVSDVEIPLFAVTCETDHIAAWRDCYRGFGMTGAKNKTFVVSQSGHIAGVVNPPSKKKYGHYTNEDLPETAADWWEGAHFHEGSWWPRWESWLSKRSGQMIAARDVGGKGYEPLCDAPGTYVVLKPEV
ncbi:class I poly(R)-hydroxyalkanoic acid synthase [Lentibacter sp. XHP0401]|uniref:class I poly(R)-hydroxyalkanoic acid synthase n=1 Tax=Lentibacter sp. XHP0401 TaxID=2984334 RepID=UPI0021E893F4|nr:class I poly(R)-hydroxyalkanoic acid synthase [Lentibacter sp. XHP0401]MCV2893266.1 class I poly(R)-hydroxyalkanoic acid synthase [Lentibacter sp. XHP0401]